MTTVDCKVLTGCTEDNNCNECDKEPLPNPTKPKVTKSVREEFDYVDDVLDDVLAQELENSKKMVEHLDALREQTNKDSVCLQLASNPSNAFRSRIKISKDSTTVELLKYTGCKPGTNEPIEELATLGETEGSALEESQHPNTIRRYVASILAFFSNLRVEYTSNGKVYTRKLPVFYGNREKLLYIEEHEFHELMNGNTNYLPRASIMLDSMTYDNNRQQNKNVAVAKEMTLNSLTSSNAYAMVTKAPSPYNISMRLNIVTRGMNDAMMLVEQICSYFNPFHNFSLIEQGLETSVRLQLDSVTFEHPEMDQFSNNEVMLEFAFTLYGNMYKPSTKEFIVDTIILNI